MEAKVIRDTEGKIISVLGDKQTIKITGKDTEGKLTVIQQELSAGAGIPMHTHSLEDENFEIIKGEVEVKIGAETFLLRSGDTIYLPKNIPHSLNALSDAKLKINIVPAGIEDMFEELSQLSNADMEFKRIAEICKRYGVLFS